MLRLKYPCENNFQYSFRIYQYSQNQEKIACKFRNFREGFIFAKFREIKILAKWQNHSVVY